MSQPPFDNDPDHYKADRKLIEKKYLERLSSATRFQRISERRDHSDFPKQGQECISEGRHMMRYRGFDMCKCPQDLVLYHQLFEMVQPKTIIEVGTLSGGMAIWMADNLKLLQINSCNVFSMDLDLSNLSDVVKKVKPDNVTFLQGDSLAIEKTFTPEFLAKLPHPWVFIDDAHVNIPAVLRYFHRYCLEGDYMVVEDTSPDVPCQMGMTVDYMRNNAYSTVGRKKLDSLNQFLAEYQEYYAVDSLLTDMFGYNGSWHWNGFVRKMK